MSRDLPDPVAEPTIKAARVAAILGVSTRSIHYAVERGEMPAVRVGRSVRILTRQFLAQYGLADQRSVPATRPAPAVIRSPGAA